MVFYARNKGQIKNRDAPLDKKVIQKFSGRGILETFIFNERFNK